MLWFQLNFVSKWNTYTWSYWSVSCDIRLLNNARPKLSHADFGGVQLFPCHCISLQIQLAICFCKAGKNTVKNTVHLGDFPEIIFTLFMADFSPRWWISHLYVAHAGEFTVFGDFLNIVFISFLKAFTPEWWIPIWCDPRQWFSHNEYNWLMGLLLLTTIN